jgi:Protein of unknown function (DUF3738)
MIYAVTLLALLLPTAHCLPQQHPAFTVALSLYVAVRKELGLKLEKVQCPEPGLVIDHIDDQPTPNQVVRCSTLPQIGCPGSRFWDPGYLYIQGV